jgi:hypothetical protein
VIIWTASTGDAGAADTRALAATEAAEAVLAHWGRQHPVTGAGEGVRIWVEATDAYIGPARDEAGCYELAGTTAMMDMVRDHLAQPAPETDIGQRW